MNGNDAIRGHEYTALMNQVQDTERTSWFCWIGSGIMAAVLLSNAISSHSPGLLLPVQACAALGFYVTVQARQRVRQLETYMRETYETEGSTQWCTRRAQLTDGGGWQTLALANALSTVSVVFSWVFANGAAHGELLAGLATIAGVGFSVLTIVEHMRSETERQSAAWSNASTTNPVREVTPTRRAG
jgi:hypothetical protein